MKKKTIYSILAVLFTVSMCNISSAQDNTLYMMKQLPEVSDINPAIQPEYGGYVLLPGLSSFQLGIHNNGFSYWDAIHYGTGSQSDSLVIDLDNLGEKLEDQNYLRLENKVNLLGFGFRIKNSYVSFGLSSRIEGRLGYPADFVNIRKGNYNSETDKTRDINFSGLGVDVIGFSQLAVGFSTEIFPGFTVGAKVKRLWGAANITSQRSDLVLETAQDDYTMTARSNMAFRVAYPMEIKRDDNGDFDGINMKGPDPVNDLIFSGNSGFAFDLGATYKLDDRFDFSAAVVDLGGISWSANTHEFKIEGLYEFDGINASPNEDGDIILDDELNNIPDTLESTFKPEVESGLEYRSSLTTKIFLNANYRVTESFSLSVLNRNLIYEGRLHPELTLGAEITPTTWFTGKVTYSMMDRTYNNLGLGIGLRGGVFQFYLLQDDIISLLSPHTAQTYNVRLGLNITWGFEEKIDQTLIE